MKLLKYALLGAICAASPSVNAQECDIDLQIAAITKGNVVPEAVEQRLEAKLTQALSKAGVIGAPYDAQFFIAGRFDDAYNDVTGGPSQKVIVKTTLTLFIGDAVNQKVFASESFDLKGVGSTDQMAYNRVLNQINPSNPKLVKFIQEGRDKIIEYYDNNYSSILAKARQAMTGRKYDEALFYATSIPSCSKGYAEASQLATKIYSDNIDYAGAQLLAKARGEWAAHPDAEGAEQAHYYLSQIDPGAACYPQVAALTKEISKTVKRNWEFENIQKHNDAVALQKQRIAAARAVGVAWASNRPRTRVVNRYYFIR